MVTISGLLMFKRKTHQSVTRWAWTNFQNNKSYVNKYSISFFDLLLSPCYGPSLFSTYASCWKPFVLKVVLRTLYYHCLQLKKRSANKVQSVDFESFTILLLTSAWRSLCALMSVCDFSWRDATCQHVRISHLSALHRHLSVKACRHSDWSGRWGILVEGAAVGCLSWKTGEEGVTRSSVRDALIS